MGKIRVTGKVRVTGKLRVTGLGRLRKMAERARADTTPRSEPPASGTP